jgi:hypothetical protein
MLQPVLGIRDILVRIRIRILGSVPLANGSGSESVPLYLMDPDPGDPKNIQIRIPNNGCSSVMSFLLGLV